MTGCSAEMELFAPCHSTAIYLCLEPELNAKLESPIGEQYSGPGSCTFYMSILTQMSSPRQTHQVLMLWLTNFWLTSYATELICDPGEAKQQG